MNEKVKKQVRTVIKDEIRKGEMGKMSEALQTTEVLFDSVFVDVKELQKQIAMAIKNSGVNNPLNAIFKIFGLRLVKEDSFENGVVRDKEASKSLRNYLVLNEELMRDSVAQVANAMNEIERKYIEREIELVNTSNKSIQENEILRKKIANNISEMNATYRDIAIALQDIICTSGDSNVVNELQNVLRDMGFTVIWEMTNDRLFNTQAGIDIAKKADFKGKVQGNKYISKPAILKNDEIVVKGYAYIDEVC